MERKIGRFWTGQGEVVRVTSLIFQQYFRYIARYIGLAYLLVPATVFLTMPGMESTTEITHGSPTDRPEVRRRKDPQKSRISNGSALLPGVDGRSPWVRRAKDLIAAYSTDTPDPSAAEHSLIRRASALTVELERLEETFAKAGAADTGDLETYQRCANTLRRLLGGDLQRRLAA
jgi:hypothetical protein